MKGRQRVLRSYKYTGYIFDSNTQFTVYSVRCIADMTDISYVVTMHDTESRLLLIAT